jgi:hypothetical protein
MSWDEKASWLLYTSLIQDSADIARGQRLLPIRRDEALQTVKQMAQLRLCSQSIELPMLAFAAAS